MPEETLEELEAQKNVIKANITVWREQHKKTVEQMRDIPDFANDVKLLRKAVIDSMEEIQALLKKLRKRHFHLNNGGSIHDEAIKEQICRLAESRYNIQQSEIIRDQRAANEALKHERDVEHAKGIAAFEALLCTQKELAETQVELVVAQESAERWERRARNLAAVLDRRFGELEIAKVMLEEE